MTKLLKIFQGNIAEYLFETYEFSLFHYQFRKAESSAIYHSNVAFSRSWSVLKYNYKVKLVENDSTLRGWFTGVALDTSRDNDSRKYDLVVIITKTLNVPRRRLELWNDSFNLVLNKHTMCIYFDYFCIKAVSRGTAITSDHIKNQPAICSAF